MDRTERFYLIDRLLKTRKTVPLDSFLEELAVSRATFKRDIEYLRDRLNAPIEWDRTTGGYRYRQADPDSPAYSLPGLWLNASEIHALLVMEHLVSNLQPGLLKDHVAPLESRLKALLGGGDHSSQELTRRIRMISPGSRPVQPAHFGVVSQATLGRKRLDLVYFARSRGEETRRQVSPQRIVYYRDNWYVDAWCHWREGLRSFALDSIRAASVSEAEAIEVPDEQLDRELGRGYGIFSGSQTELAVLRFTPEAARWVAQQNWHPEQKGRFDESGNYILEVPFAGDRELVMDILRYGPDVEVLAPDALRERVRESLEAALGRYLR